MNRDLARNVEVARDGSEPTRLFDSDPPNPLAIITSCDGCGACCLVVTRPPFVRRLDGSGEDAWERLVGDHPRLASEILAADRTRQALGAPDFGTPCLWFDPETLRCRHYDNRPRACREFASDSPDCRDARRRAGVAKPGHATAPRLV